MEKNVLTKRFEKGDKVVYIHTGEEGTVTSTNDRFVFVRYKKNGLSQCTSNATNPQDLEFLINQNK